MTALGASLTSSGFFSGSSSSCYFLSCSCWLLMVSRSLAMKRSTITSHSLLFWCFPCRMRTSRVSIQKIIEIDLAYLFPHGITISMKSRGASVLQRAMVGMFTYEASTTACLSDLGSATINNLGYWNFLVSWLVSVPGIHLEEALAVHLVYCPNL